MDQMTPTHLVALVALLSIVGGMVPGGLKMLISAVTGKGASGSTASADARGVNIQMGGSSPGVPHPGCDRATEHSYSLKQLADVQARQIALDERMSALLERMDARMRDLETGVLELVMGERIMERRSHNGESK